MATKTLKCDIDLEHATQNSEDFPPLRAPDENAAYPYDIGASSEDSFDKPVDILNIVDVYNVASSVGQEFERLTDAFGGAVFSGVMPKIIRALEMLESLVMKKEEDACRIFSLNDTLQKVEMDSNLKDNKRKEEIDTIECARKDEIRNLMETISTLKDDNQKLAALLTDKLQEEGENEVKPQSEQTALVSKLQQQIGMQRDEIRLKNSVIEEQTQEAEALQSQTERLAKLNTEVRSKIHILEEQAKLLIEEKMDLEAELNESRKQLSKHRILPVQEAPDNFPVNKPQGMSTTEIDHPSLDDSILTDRLVIDLKDPNRPRYTLNELHEVLNDRNKLKAQCFLLEEKLLSYRKEERSDKVDEHEIEESQNHVIQNQSKPAKSGIRRFFSYIAGDGSWRKQDSTKPTTKHSTAPSTEKHQQSNVAGCRQHLVDPNNVEELVPGIGLEKGIGTTENSKPVSTEM